MAWRLFVFTARVCIQVDTFVTLCVDEILVEVLSNAQKWRCEERQQRMQTVVKNLLLCRGWQ